MLEFLRPHQMPSSFLYVQSRNGNLVHPDCQGTLLGLLNVLNEHELLIDYDAEDLNLIREIYRDRYHSYLEEQRGELDEDQWRRQQGQHVLGAVRWGQNGVVSHCLRWV